MAYHSTTAGALATELKSHLSALRQSSEDMEQQVSSIEASCASIRDELNDAIKTFVQGAVSELQGDRFNEMATLAESVPQLSGQGLSFYRKKLLEGRETALRTVNATLTETVDVEGFQKLLASKQANAAAEAEKVRAAEAVVSEADRGVDALKSTTEYQLITLDDAIASKGGKKLTQDNKAYYEPSNIVTAAYRWLARGSEYRKVRKILVKARHGRDGRDLFADLAGVRQKIAERGQVLADANTALQGVQAGYEAAAGEANKLAALSDAIKTDDQMLVAVQEKVASYFKTPEFIAAAANHYAEDFPRSVPVLTTRLNALGALQQDVRENMATLQTHIDAVEEQYNKAEGAANGAEVKLDLTGLKKEALVRAGQYDTYLSEANVCRTSLLTSEGGTPANSPTAVNHTPLDMVGGASLNREIDQMLSREAARIAEERRIAEEQARAARAAEARRAAEAAARYNANRNSSSGFPSSGFGSGSGSSFSKPSIGSGSAPSFSKPSIGSRGAPKF